VLLLVPALACTVAACSTAPHVSAQQKRAVAEILQNPNNSTARSSGNEKATATTTTAPSPPPSKSKSTSTSTTSSSTVGPGSSSPPPTSTASSAPSAPPNVVGQNLSNAESQLQAVGYSVAAHPWGASCSTLDLVMQQVPPQSGTIQLFYCANPS